jgi:tetratricopeptide (TPR) repeat protein
MLPQINVAMHQGQLARAIELTGRAESESVAKTGLKGAGASAWSNAGVAAAQMGDAVAARAAVRRALALDRDVNTLINGAFALAIVGDAAESQKLADEARRLPLSAIEDAQIGFKFIEAFGNVRRADVGAGRVAAPRADDDVNAHFMIGFVNLQLGIADVAAQHFKTLVDRKAATLSSICAEAPLYYGRALGKLGKVEEGRKAYEQFFETWTHADANLPLLVAAKKEYAALAR